MDVVTTKAEQLRIQTQECIEQLADRLCELLTVRPCTGGDELVFNHLRGWRFDLTYARMGVRVGVDFHGLGKHITAKGRDGDMEKSNAAIEAGWKVLTYPSRCVRTAKRRERIAQQIARVVTGARSDDDAACVISTWDDR